MQIFQRQGQIFRDRTIVGHNAEHGPLRTVHLHPTLAKFAHRPKSVSRAGHVDLARHALAYPPLLPLRGNSGDIRYLPDKFMSQRAAKPMLAAQELHVSIAYPAHPHTNARPSWTQP